jgi:hypothetical protein
MNNILWMQRLISSGLFGIVLLIASSAFADTDREDLIKLQVRQNELASGLKNLQGRVRDSSPTKWELQALQFVIKESGCLNGLVYKESPTPIAPSLLLSWILYALLDLGNLQHCF